MHLDDGYWQRLDRRLELMGEEADGRLYLTRRLVRCAAVALPVLAFPFLFRELQLLAVYPIFTAVLFRQELKALEKRYQEWQKCLIRDVPEVVDRLRICFAGGRDYLSALEGAAAGTTALGRALEKLTEDIRTRGSQSALASFSASFDLPATNRLASALALAIESGYEAAEVYLVNIEEELRQLRQEAAEALVKGKPEKGKTAIFSAFYLGYRGTFAERLGDFRTG